MADLITRLRTDSPRSAITPPAAQQATTESLRQRLHTTRAEITSLRAENTRSENGSPANSANNERDTVHQTGPGADATAPR